MGNQHGLMMRAAISSSPSINSASVQQGLDGACSRGNIFPGIFGLLCCFFDVSRFEDCIGGLSHALFSCGNILEVLQNGMHGQELLGQVGFSLPLTLIGQVFKFGFGIVG